MTKKTSAHENCTHESSSAARNKCRQVTRLVAQYEAEAMTNEKCQELLDSGESVQVMSWRVEDTEKGPKMITHVGTLERSYQHRDGFTVWIVVSDKRPEGTGHLACRVRVTGN